MTRNRDDRFKSRNEMSRSDRGRSDNRGRGRDAGFSTRGDHWGTGQRGDYGADDRQNFGRDNDDRDGFSDRGGDGQFGGGVGRFSLSDDDSSGMRPGQPGMTSHRGKGPKGYQRRDERLQEMVGEALEDDHGVDASDVEVRVEGGEVTPMGTVQTALRSAVPKTAPMTSVGSGMCTTRSGSGETTHPLRATTAAP